MTNLFLNGVKVGVRHGDSYTFNKENTFERMIELQPEIILVFSAEFDPHHYKVWDAYLAHSTLKSCIVCHSYKSYYHHHHTDHLRTSVPLFSEETGFNINDLGHVPSLKALLYPANISRNWMYFYTLPKQDHVNKNIKHIHIGHGDSDKSSSSTRVQKIYDHSLVADAMAMDRYAKNHIALPADHFLLMGAPVFPGIEVSEGPSPIDHLLYLPTFEGPSHLMNYSSLSYVSQLLAKEFKTNTLSILYHPHPAMGLRVNEYKLISDQFLESSAFNKKSKVEHFNTSNAAICDISGVTSEYLFTGKPIIIPFNSSFNFEKLLNPEFKKICYFWDIDHISIRNFLRSIVHDPLRKNRMEFRNRKFMHAKSFAESVSNFDNALSKAFISV